MLTFFDDKDLLSPCANGGLVPPFVFFAPILSSRNGGGRECIRGEL